MELDVKKGYLIRKYDYDVFDEIIYFLTNEGELIQCFSNGSRKINSKNGRNLFYANFIEIEYFKKNNNKLNKLKKAVAIRQVDSSIYSNKILQKINVLITKFKFSKNDKIYLLYQEILALIMLDKNESEVFNYFFFKFVSLINPVLKDKKCFKCNSFNLSAFSFENQSFLCNLCFSEFDIFFLDFEISLIKKYINANLFIELKKEDFIANNNIYKKIIKKLIKYKSSNFIKN